MVQRSSEDFPPLSVATAKKATRGEEKKLRADAKEAAGLHAPETWWRLFGLEDSHSEAKTLGIDNYAVYNHRAVHVTLYKVNSAFHYFQALSVNQIMDALLGSEAQARGLNKRGIHVTLEVLHGPKPRCFRGNQFVNTGGDGNLETALSGHLKHFLRRAKQIIRHQKNLIAQDDLTEAASNLGSSFMADL